MNPTELSAKIDRLIADKNYIAACGLLREGQAPSEDFRLVCTGKIAQAILEDLSRARDREKIAYFRSLLLWTVRDIPSLSSIYREQLKSQRLSRDNLWEVLDSLKRISETGDVSGAVTEAIEVIRRNLEEGQERATSGEGGEKVRDFITTAEHGIRQGVRQFNDFIDSVIKRKDDLDKPVAPETRPAKTDAAPEAPKTSSDDPDVVQSEAVDPDLKS